MDKSNIREQSDEKMEEQPKAVSLCAQLDEQLLKEQEKSLSAKPYYPLRPSSAGKCARYLAHELMSFEGKEEGLVELKKPSVIRLLGLGHSIEWNAISLLSKLSDYSVRFKQQVVSICTLTSGKLIEGSIDGVLWSESKPKILFDIKSVGNGWDNAFSNRWEKDKERIFGLPSVSRLDDQGVFVRDIEAFIEELGEHALVSNLLQVNLYLCSDFAKERGIRQGSIYRYEKNSSQHFEVRFSPNENLAQYVKQKYDEVDQVVIKGDPTLVKKEFVLGSMACAYCPYINKCWPNATKKEQFAGSPKKNWATRVTDLDQDTQDNVIKAASSYVTAKQQEDRIKRAEDEFVQAIEATGESRLKFPNGRVYKIQLLKSPPRAVIREDKE